MIIDIILILCAAGAVFAGYQRGLLHTLLSTIGYIGGGVLGLLLALNFLDNVHTNFNRFMAVIIAIFLAAEIGRRLIGSLARYVRTRILWAPLRFLDSVGGVALELARLVVISYLVISALLWSPWQVARESVADSKIFAKVSEYQPKFVDQLRSEIDKKLSISLPK
ncbi:MAG: CvpA family protein [Actinobacteria bacterium]|nr:CvpA family protein [Actinomycetota bacterium]